MQSLVFIILTLSTLVVADCNVAPKYAVGINKDSVMMDNITRTWNVYVPASYDQTKPTSAVFVFHGGFGTGTIAENAYKMDAQADANNFITVYPDGYQNAWNTGPLCCGVPSRNNINDVGFVSAIIDVLKSKLCINTERVFATGMSNGAVFSYTLACKLSDIISGVAIVEGSLMAIPCTPTRPISILVIHGTADKNIPFNGGIGCGVSFANWKSVPYGIDTMTTLNGCACGYGGSCGASTTIQDATCTTYGACSSNSSVQLCVVNGGGHTWSGAARNQGDFGPNCDTTVGTYPASQQIWKFFSEINYNGSRNTSITRSSVASQNFVGFSFAIWLIVLLFL